MCEGGKEEPLFPLDMTLTTFNTELAKAHVVKYSTLKIFKF